MLHVPNSNLTKTENKEEVSTLLLHDQEILCFGPKLWAVACQNDQAAKTGRSFVTTC